MIYIFFKKNNDDFIFLLTMKVKQTQESWQHQGEPDISVTSPKEHKEKKKRVSTK